MLAQGAGGERGRGRHLRQARWRGQDGWPAWLCYADALLCSGLGHSLSLSAHPRAPGQPGQERRCSSGEAGGSNPGCGWDRDGRQPWRRARPRLLRAARPRPDGTARGDLVRPGTRAPGQRRPPLGKGDDGGENEAISIGDTPDGAFISLMSRVPLPPCAMGAASRKCCCARKDCACVSAVTARPARCAENLGIRLARRRARTQPARLRFVARPCLRGRLARPSALPGAAAKPWRPSHHCSAITAPLAGCSRPSTSVTVMARHRPIITGHDSAVQAEFDDHRRHDMAGNQDRQIGREIVGTVAAPVLPASRALRHRSQPGGKQPRALATRTMAPRPAPQGLAQAARGGCIMIWRTDSWGCAASAGSARHQSPIRGGCR
jgi:hypothetical protein